MEGTKYQHSHKLKGPGISHLLVVQLNGRVVFISPGVPAAVHDVTVLKKFLLGFLNAIRGENRKSLEEWKDEYPDPDIIFADLEGQQWK